MAEFIAILRDIRDVKYPEIIAKHSEVITRGDALVQEMNDSEALMRDVISKAAQVAQDTSEVRELSSLTGTNTAAVSTMKAAIDQSKIDIGIKEQSVKDTYAGLLANLTSINQSISAANVIKHDMESSTLAAADVNYYLMSTITKADNAQNALDLKVQQNLVALNDILNDNVYSLEAKAQAAGDMIDLKIAMAYEARNSLSLIEQSVIIASASADKAALAYENIKDTKELIDTVMSDAAAMTATLGDLVDQSAPAVQALNDASTAADTSKTLIDESIIIAQSVYGNLNLSISEAQALGMNTLVQEATAQADRLEVVIPVAQNLSAETEAAVTAAQNVSQATTLGNTLLNALEGANTQANEYIATIDDAIANGVDAKIEEIIGVVADAKIAEIIAVAISNQEAIDGIADADISALVM